MGGSILPASKPPHSLGSVLPTACPPHHPSASMTHLFSTSPRTNPTPLAPSLHSYVGSFNSYQTTCNLPQQSPPLSTLSPPMPPHQVCRNLSPLPSFHTLPSFVPFHYHPCVTHIHSSTLCLTSLTFHPCISDPPHFPSPFHCT